MEQVTYDRNYLAGILFFNQRDFFEAHEVWEDLWTECASEERKFYQALIQAAVGLLHFSNGNINGATKLYRSSRAYMEPYGSPYLGLDTVAFWQQMERCFAPILGYKPQAIPDQAEDLHDESFTPIPGPKPPELSVRPDETLIPVITLDPPPEQWPDLAEFEEEGE